MTFRKTALALTTAILLFPALQSPGLSQESGGVPDAQTEDQLKDRIGSRLLAAAWEQYRAENYQKAAELFRLAVQAESPAQQNQARLGLGYSLERLGQTAEAESVFIGLWGKGYDPARTGPALLGIYLAQSRLGEAEALVGQLPVSVREEWYQRLQLARTGRESGAATQTMREAWDALSQKNYSRAAELFQSAGKGLSADREQEAQFGLAYAVWGLGRLSKARGIFEKLLRQGYKTEKIKPDLVRLLLSQNEIERAKILIGELPPEKQEAFSKDILEARQRQRDLRLESLYLSLDRTKDPAQKKRLALEILKLEPENRDVLGILGWSCRELKQYDCALETFQKLYSLDPTPEHLLGLSYTLVDLGRADEAMALLERHHGTPPPEARNLQARLYRESAGKLYEREEYGAAEKVLRRALEINPEDRESRELLGWALYNQGSTEEALEIFRELFEEESSARYANGLIVALERDSRKREAFEFLGRLAEEKSRPELLKLAADRYADAGWYAEAARTLPDPDACYYNCDKSWLELAPQYRFRDGDEGTSQLAEYAIPINLHMPLTSGGHLSFGITALYLDAGRADETPYAGSFYRLLDDSSIPVRDLVTDRTVWQPMLAYEQKGPLHYRLAIGTTPLSGPVSPMPTIDVQVENAGKWLLRLSQCAVENSLLSLIGQEDPYSNRMWGRVVQTFLKGEKTWDLGRSYWLTIGGRYGYLWGENTEDNQAISATVSTGHSQSMGPGELTYGLFATAEHFENNQDFYTYGHGGYFSPDFFFMAGPFFSYRSSSCKGYIFNLEASLGYMSYRTSDAPIYRQKDDLSTPATAASLRDFNGIYKGEEKDGLGLRAQAEVGKLLTPSVAVGGLAGIDTSQGYTEWRGGVWLRIYFQPRRAICQEFPSEQQCPYGFNLHGMD